MPRRSVRRLLLLVVTSALAISASAPASRGTPYTLAGTYLHALPRSANGRNYTLYVNTPASYANATTRKYPVVYITDGYWDFSLLTWEAGNLVVDGLIPECIVVGIAYSGTNPDVGSLRQWDLTPGYDPYAGPNSGHAQEFLSVIEHQFIPFVEKNYRVDRSFRVLGGSSYGGLFTMYAMFARPGLFQAHIAVSPALWYQSRTIATRATTYAKTHKSLQARVYLTFAGDESAAIRDATRDFARQLRDAKFQNFAVAVREIAGERHSSTKAEGYHRGLRFVFANRAPQKSYVYDKGWGSRDAFLRFTTRGRVGTGSAIMVAAFTIEGPETKTVLIRAAGPALASLGVAGTLGNPVLRVRDTRQKVVASNDDWGTAANLTALRQAMAGSVPAFATGSRDSAALVTLEAGSYTVEVEGVNKTQGIAAVDVIEILP